MYKKVWFWALTLSLVIAFGQETNAQYSKEAAIPDTTFLRQHSPHRATFYSAVLPGLGQIYNQKYWKVPVIYAGFGGLIYYAGYNNFVYNKYKSAYEVKLRIANGDTSLEDEYSYLTTTAVSNLKDSWRRYRDLCFIGIGLLYVAQIIDADVDAHLFDYDISEDLSMRVEPVILEQNVFTRSNSVPVGMRCSIRF